MSLAASQMMAGGEVDGEGAARRRRQRRLRSWLKHERQSVAMALAEYTHHASRGQTRARAREEAGSETYYAPRGLKTLPPGTRPAPPSEVAGPQGAAASGGYVAAGAPLLAVSSLRGADGVDDTAVKYLLRAELMLKKEEEEEEERKQELADEALDDKLDAEMDALLAIERLTSRQQARLSVIIRERAELVERRKKRRTMRKRKKRRKRRTPRTSSLPGRACRRQRQWHVPVSLFDMWSMSLLCGSCSFHRCNDEICADNYIYFRFKLKAKGRSEQWEVFLFGDKTIEVDRDRVEVLPRGVLPPGIGGVGFGSSPILATDHTIYELCLSERGMGMSMNLADPVSSGMSAGHACPRLQLRYLP